MLRTIVEAQALDQYKVRLKFEDSVEGVVDLADQLRFRGVFEPLRDPDFFDV